MSTRLLFKNNVTGTLAAGINGVVTALTVGAGEGALFGTPSVTQPIRGTLKTALGAYELVDITGVAGDVLTIVRARESTPGIAFIAGSTISIRATAGVMEAMAQKAADETISGIWTFTTRPAGINELSESKLCPHSNLVGTYATAATATFTADALLLADSSGAQKLFTSLSETLTITNTGANGRDVTENSGNEKPSDWYHIWAIGKADGTLDVFASVDCFPGGTSVYARLPATYLYAGYIGAIYNNATPDFVKFYQRGEAVSMYVSPFPLTAGTSTSQASVNLAAYIPDTARVLRASLGVYDSTSGASQMLVGNDATNDWEVVLVANPGGTTNEARCYAEIVIRTPQTVYYRVGTTDFGTIIPTGWRF